MLAGLSGEWRPCRIRGRMGAFRGFKSFRYDPQGPETRPGSWSLPNSLGLSPSWTPSRGRNMLAASPGGGNRPLVKAQVYEGRYVD